MCTVAKLEVLHKTRNSQTDSRGSREDRQTQTHKHKHKDTDTQTHRRSGPKSRPYLVPNANVAYT